jgi:hypothetical protein
MQMREQDENKRMELFLFPVQSKVSRNKKV